jgi:hypothetical protein
VGKISSLGCNRCKLHILFLRAPLAQGKLQPHQEVSSSLATTASRDSRIFKNPETHRMALHARS